MLRLSRTVHTHSLRLFSHSLALASPRFVPKDRVPLGRRTREKRKLRRESLAINPSDVTLEISANKPPCMILC
jgi:hypothetical protein